MANSRSLSTEVLVAGYTIGDPKGVAKLPTVGLHQLVLYRDHTFWVKFIFPSILIAP
jgi:hypothetical protein